MTENAQQTRTLLLNWNFIILNIEYEMHDYLTDTHSTFSQVNRIAHCSADMLPEVKRIDSKAYIFSLPQQIWPPLPVQVLIPFRLTALPTRPQDMVDKVVQ